MSMAEHAWAGIFAHATQGDKKNDQKIENTFFPQAAKNRNFFFQPRWSTT
jgi:hypothetical protein